MILPDFILTTRQNKLWTESGMDSEKLCLDKQHFNSYPYTVEYNYNSRGFRDSEWPDDISNAIWCFGDSFTVGLGSPLEHTWVNILQNKTNIRCINVSMDGASNDWIARKVIRLLETTTPRCIIIQWTYAPRAEDNDDNKIDEDRRLAYASLDIIDHLNNFNKNLNAVNNSATTTRLIHSMIPNAYNIENEEFFNVKWNKISGHTWPPAPHTKLEFDSLSNTIKEELHTYNFYNDYYEYIHLTDLIIRNNIIQLTQIDMARDGHHYDKATAEQFVRDLMKLIY